MKKTTAFLWIGLAILFGRIDTSPPAPAAAGEVLYREGDPDPAFRGGGVKPSPEVAATHRESPEVAASFGGGVAPEPPKEIAQAPSVPVDIAELAKGATESIPSPQAKSAELHKFADAVEAIARQADEPELAPEWVQSVYPVRVRGVSTDPKSWGQSVIMDGTAVAVGPAKLHTAKHLTHQVNAYVAEVQIGGEWRQATFAGVPGKDLAVLTLSGTAALPAVKIRPPEYGERVTVYGLATKSFAQGTYTGDHNPAIGDGLIPLDKGQTAVEQGDSGGGAFGDDGCLLGTITGRRQEVHEVTAIVPIVADTPKAPAVQAAETGGAARTPPPARAVQSCPGGVCPAPQYQPQNRGFLFQQPRRGRKH